MAKKINKISGEKKSPGKMPKGGENTEMISMEGKNPKDQGASQKSQISEFVVLTPEQVSARKKRNRIIALTLLAWVVFVFLITILKLKASVLVRDL